MVDELYQNSRAMNDFHFLYCFIYGDPHIPHVCLVNVSRPESHNCWLNEHCVKFCSQNNNF